jgi:hypothetical protein
LLCKLKYREDLNKQRIKDNGYSKAELGKRKDELMRDVAATLEMKPWTDTGAHYPSVGK